MDNTTNKTINPETGTIYSLSELKAAFEKVQDATNWKNPICAAISVDDIDVVTEAVIFYAGCRPTFVPINKARVRCEAAGYYLAVGA